MIEEYSPRTDREELDNLLQQVDTKQRAVWDAFNKAYPAGSEWTITVKMGIQVNPTMPASQSILLHIPGCERPVIVGIDQLKFFTPKQ